MQPPYAIEDGNGGALPLRVDANGARDVAQLIAWLRLRSSWVEDALTRHGALLLRGFAVADAAAFEEVARAIAPALRNDFFGTPWQRLTEHVFRASDLPGPYPIAQHCEMSYLRSPPERVFFGCLVAPPDGCGETPLADFRRVWRALDPELRERFTRGGIRVVRHLRGPGTQGRDLWNLERWDELFQSGERKVVEQQCAAEGIALDWLDDDRLRLTIRQPVYRDHPRTGERVWYNQFAAHHVASSAWDYARIFALRPTPRAFLRWQMVRVTVALKRRSPAATLSFHCTYADGREIPDADMQVLLRTVWQHRVLTPWRRGDVLAIDNRSVSHGRMPFHGPREIVACLA